MPPDAPWTVRRLLEWTSPFFTRKAVDSPRLSAELLLAHILAVPRIKLYTDYERPLDDDQLTRYRALVQRAAEHEPIAHLTGRAHFFNLELDITPAVLIPRPETETLVENVLQLARHADTLQTARILDLCTGSACVAAAIAHHLKLATVTAIDLSPEAVAVARANLHRLGLSERVTVLQGDLFAPLSDPIDRRPFDLITANPPYIPTAAIASLDRNVRDYEPRLALDGGPDGLDLVRRILAEAPDRLAPGGWMFIEIAFDQGPAALDLAAAHPAYEPPKILKDHGGRDRLLAVRRTS